MTGLVPMHEYRRVVEKCERLEEEVAFLRSDVTDMKGEKRRRALRALLPPRVVHGELVLLERLLDARVVRYGDCYTVRSQTSIASSLRTALRAAGCAGEIILCVRGEGHFLTDAARAWLREKIPDAFPATKEPSR